MWWVFFVLFILISIISSTLLYYSLKRINQYEVLLTEFQKIIEFKTFELAIEYLFSLEKWPPNHPVLTGSIFLVAEFIKFAKKQKF